MLRCLLIALIPVVLSISPARAIGLEVRGDSVIRGSSGGGHTSAARLRVEVPAMPASKVADQFGQTITKQKSGGLTGTEWLVAKSRNPQITCREAGTERS